MSDEAPEHLYILWDDGGIDDWAESVCDGYEHVKYSRADLVKAEIDRLRIAATTAEGRLRGASIALSEHDAEIERLQLFKNLADEYGLSIFADLASLTKERDEALAAGERLRKALSRMVDQFGFHVVHDGLTHDERMAIHAAMDALAGGRSDE